MKEKIISVMLFLLYKGLQATAELDLETHKEVYALPDDFIFELGIAGTDCGICIALCQGKFILLKGLPSTKHYLQILLKSRTAAWNMVMGKISIAKSYAKNDLLILGEIRLAMIISRCLERVENYLFPNFMKHNIFDNPPIKSVSSLRIFFKMFSIKKGHGNVT